MMLICEFEELILMIRELILGLKIWGVLKF